MKPLTTLGNGPAKTRRKSIGRRLGILRGQSGQSLAEVALVAPLLLAVLLGGIEFGRFAYCSILVENAARAGAAYGSQSLTDATNPTDPTTGTLMTVNPGIQKAADNDFQNNGQTVANLTVTSSTACGCDSGGTITPATSCSTETDPTAGTCTTGLWTVVVTVAASDTFQSLIKCPWIPSSIPVSRTVSMRVNQYGG